MSHRVQLTSGKEKLVYIEIVVCDAENGKPLPCRISFRGEGIPPIWGEDAAGQAMAYAGPPRLWCDGRWKGELPDLPLEVVIARPYEYRTEVRRIAPGSERRIEVALRRRCDLSEKGWFCGDAHQHVVHGEALLEVDLLRAAAVARAEGMDWAVFDGRFTSLAKAREPEPEELDRLCAEASREGFLAMWADEYPKHDLGHLASFPHGHPVRPVDVGGEGIYRLGPEDRTPYANFESIRALHRRGTTAVYVHPFRELGGTPERVGNIARELPLDLLVAPWAVESVDWMSDQIDDPLCWKMWYMLLNQGYRIGLCAFNDACYDRAGGEWREPVAYRRTYVEVEGRLDWRSLVDGIRRGRTFGTTGPLVRFEVQGEGPGAVLPADGKRRAGRVRAWGAPLYGDPAEFGRVVKVELIRNGVCFRTWDFLDDPREEVDLEFSASEEETAWYVARVEGSGEGQLAVTSPVYFEGRDYRRPGPYPARVRARIFDAESGALLRGRMELVSFSKDRVEVVEIHGFEDGLFERSVPGDLRLRARVEGYEEKLLSPILDCDRIYRDLLGRIRREDLADPAYYAKLRQALDEVELSFPMIRS